MSINVLNETSNYGSDIFPSTPDIQSARNFPNTLSQSDTSKLSSLLASYLQKTSNIPLTSQKTRV